ncbi:hypothetical protein [Bradyrhizobium vignae]|uniref:Uncharacterized protein n=1 Tax=Bradyrhizobium vignae TaxID=1549949 RepID=A0ABS4A3F9_9BRAD|nr:hypothetical protein [Bradyrhizobium vignae]MBP0114949.1 hypothetical protein [Bradyrhizobium vignae]
MATSDALRLCRSGAESGIVLELGEKWPLIVFDDADLPMRSIRLGSSALSRMRAKPAPVAPAFWSRGR